MEWNTGGPPDEVDPLDETYHAVHDPGSGRPSVTVVTAVADAFGLDPETVAVPVYERVDPDALDTLFEDHQDGRVRTAGYVAVPLWNHTVVFHADGDIFVHPPDCLRN